MLLLSWYSLCYFLPGPSLARLNPPLIGIMRSISVTAYRALWPIWVEVRTYAGVLPVVIVALSTQPGVSPHGQVFAVLLLALDHGCVNEGGPLQLSPCAFIVRRRSLNRFSSDVPLAQLNPTLPTVRKTQHAALCPILQTSRTCSLSIVWFISLPTFSS